MMGNAPDRDDPDPIGPARAREPTTDPERVRLLEEIADGLVDMLDGEPSGSDSLDWALHRYGYRPTKGVQAPPEE